MFLLVKDVLTPAELAEIRRLAAPLRFIDGKISNPHNQAKNNLQVDTTQPDALKASNIAGAAISRRLQHLSHAPAIHRRKPASHVGQIGE